MKRSRFSEEQIIGILREQEAGSPTADVCRKHGISSGDVLQVEGEVRRSRRVGCQAAEGAGGRERKLKKLLAETMLDNAILKDINSRKW